MATRSLTEVFILMRNNAIQNRHIYAEQISDDRTALVMSDSDMHVVTMHRGSHSSTLPPEWVDSVEEVQRQLPVIRSKMKNLASLHDRHLNRPTLDDSLREEQVIEDETGEITRMFHKCQTVVHTILNQASRSTPQQQKLSRNVASSLARELQDLSAQFRKFQSTYLEKMKSREQRASHFFETDDMQWDTQGFEEVDLYNESFAKEHTQVVKENTAAVQQREKEIKHITQSIVDLNMIFKDLAAMIVDQGTVLDRIDYNIEQTSIHVEEGHKQLVKAEKHQKKNRKMLIILVLAGIVVVLLITLLIVKG